MVPRDKRDALAVYAFARSADNVADEPGVENRLGKLAEWRAKLVACYAGKIDHPVFLALRDCAERFRLSRENFENLLRAFESDVVVNRHPEFASLLAYCTCYANPGIPSQDTKVARRWLLLAGVRAYFSGSVHTEIDKLLRRLRDKMFVRLLWKAMSRVLRKLRPHDCEASRISDPVTSLYLSMLANNDARDWGDRYLRLDGKVLGHNANLQVHHFFPRSLLRKHGFGRELINTFANYTVLSADTNLEVGAEEPATYMKRIKVSDTRLKKQCIPTDRTLWRLDRFDSFLKERRGLLAEAANNFLGI